MTAATIQPGDRLTLKPDNAYGLCEPQNGYGDEWAFKPSDFQRHA